MNRGLLIKIARETWFLTLLFGLALGAFEAFFTTIVPTFFTQFPVEWLQMDFIQNMLQGLLGAQVGDSIGPGVVVAVAWVHPIALAIIWAHEISICTRMPAGEIDRGTIDVLLALPISRRQICMCELFVWLSAGLAVVLMGAAGNTIGGMFVSAEFRVSPGRLLVVVANLYCVYFAVGGMAWMVSAMSDSRGRAVGISLGIVLASVILNFLAQFWPLAESISFLSVLTYYRPFLILSGSTWPTGDLLVLGAAGVAFWSIGAIIFVRRDVCTV